MSSMFSRVYRLSTTVPSAPRTVRGRLAEVICSRPTAFSPAPS
jgi:hypothetical protein